MVKDAPRRRSSLVQERSQHSRASLVEAAEALWSESDVDAVRVEDICEEAGVSKGLFYFYFASKEDLVLELLLLDADDVAAAIERSIDADEDTDATIDRALSVMARRAQRRPRHLLARGVSEWFASLERHDVLAEGHTTLEDAFADAAAHGQARDEISPDHSPAEVGGVLAWALLRAQLEWATATSRQPSLSKRLARRADLVMRGATVS